MSKIVVSPSVNRGAPSIMCQNGGYSTVKQVEILRKAFMDSGEDVGELVKELGLSVLEIETCRLYAEKYKEILL